MSTTTSATATPKAPIRFSDAEIQAMTTIMELRSLGATSPRLRDPILASAFTSASGKVENYIRAHYATGNGRKHKPTQGVYENDSDD